jgi:hypothetical protein
MLQVSDFVRPLQVVSRGQVIPAGARERGRSAKPRTVAARTVIRFLGDE